MFQRVIIFISILITILLAPSSSFDLSVKGFNNFYIDNQSKVYTSAISQNDHYIIAGYADNNIRIWDIDNKQLIYKFSGHRKRINSVCISQNRYILSTSEDKTIKLWDLQNKKLLYTKKYKNKIISIALSQNSKYIVVGIDKNITLLDMQSGKLIYKFEGHEDLVKSVAISSDNSYIVSGSVDNSIKLWGIKNRSLLFTFRGHTDNINSISISRDNKYIVSSSDDNSIKLWDLAQHKIIYTFENGEVVNSIALSSDNRYIVSSSGNRIKLWSIEEKRLLDTLEVNSKLLSVYFSHNNRYIISNSLDNGIKLWDLKKRHLIYTFKGVTDNSIKSIAFSKNGKYIIVGTNNKDIKIWDTNSSVLKNSFYGHNGSINAVSIGNKNQYIVSGSNDKKVKLWDINGTLTKSFASISSNISSIAISSNTKYIVAGLDNGNIKLFNQNRLIKSFEKAHKDRIKSIAINDKYIVSGSWDNNIIIWSIRTKKEFCKFDNNDSVNSIAISNKYIVSGSNSDINVWNIKDKKRFATLRGDNNLTMSVGISSDNEYIVSGSAIGTIDIWSIKEKKKLYSLDSKTQKSIISVNISQDNKYILYATKNRIKLWNIEDRKLSKEFIYGNNGEWIIFDYQKKRLIGEYDKRFIYKKKELYSDKNGTIIELVPLPPINISKKEFLTIKRDRDINLTILNDKKATDINLTILNDSNISLFDIEANIDSDYFTLKSNIIPIIKSKEKKKITLKLYTQMSPFDIEPLSDIDEITIIFTTRSGNRFSISIPIYYSNIIIENGYLSKDKDNIIFEIENIGNKELSKVDIKLSKPFKDSKSENNFIKDNIKKVKFNIPTFRGYNPSPSIFEISIKSDKESWDSNSIKIKIPFPRWYAYLIIILFLIFIYFSFGYIKSIFYHLRYRNDILIVKLLNNIDEIFFFNTKELIRIGKILNRTDKLSLISKKIDIDIKNLKRVILFYRTLDIKIFCDLMGIEKYEKDGDFYRLTLPRSFNLQIDSFLLYFDNECIEDNIDKIIKLEKKVFVITNRDCQDKIAQKAKQKDNRLVAPTLEELNRMLLISTNSYKILADTFINCLEFKDVLPYQTKRGIDSQSNFFGRGDIIKDIFTKRNTNYFIVGARQLGKSSILKELERRYIQNSEVECYLCNMDSLNGNIVLELSSKLGMPKESTIDDIRDRLYENKNRVIFLIDESDEFIELDKNTGYKITSVFKKLSEDGKATFVFAGFWQLYFYVTSDYHSVFKNFGEIIRLEGLEQEACRDLMIKPMARLGISYENNIIIDNLIERCGQRANLISIISNAILKNLKGYVITQNDIDYAVEHSYLEENFRDWYVMDKKGHNVLHRVIVYITINKKSFRLKDVMEILQKYNIRIDSYTVRDALERLVLGFILKRYRGNYSYRVPLFIEQLLDEDIELLLGTDIKWMQSHYKTI